MQVRVKPGLTPGRFSADARLNTPMVPSGPFAGSQLAGAT